MPRRPLIVLADDLTGAAEVAAIAHDHGLRASVITRAPREPLDAQVLVFDTDTRLATPLVAARRVRAATTRLKKIPHRGFFKKTDSVLRGPVLAELAACMHALGKRRALLVAGNPSLGRVIRDGQFLIDGKPLDQTGFARDPHHPARSAAVLDLVQARHKRGVTSTSPDHPLPRLGVIAGDHRSTADTLKWARAVDHSTLPAGGADFFRAWLRLQSDSQRPPTARNLVLEPALLLHGTTLAPATSRLLRFNGLRAPSAVRVAAALRQRRAVAVAATSLTIGDPLAPPIVARNFGELARSLRDKGAFRHLLVAGGATAASVLHALGWNRLEVIRLWGPGVVSLRPVAAPDFLVTLKPGSYPWPESIRRALPAVFP